YSCRCVSSILLVILHAPAPRHHTRGLVEDRQLVPSRIHVVFHGSLLFRHLPSIQSCSFKLKNRPILSHRRSCYRLRTNAPRWTFNGKLYSGWTPLLLFRLCCNTRLPQRRLTWRSSPGRPLCPGHLLW